MRRRRLSAVGVVAVAACVLVGRSLADDPLPVTTNTPAVAVIPTPSTTTTTTAAATSTAVAPATSTAAAASTTTTTTTTTTPTTSAATTSTVQTGTTVPAATTTMATTPINAAQLAPAPAPRPGCAVVSAVVLQLPHASLRVVGPVVPSVAPSATGPLSYPADGTLVDAVRVSLKATCAPGRAPSAKVALSSPSFLGGLVTADSITLTMSPAGAQTNVQGLQVNGSPVSLTSGSRVLLPGWGWLVAPPSGKTPRRAPATARGPAPEDTNAFSIELTRSYAGLPAGTVLFAADASRLAPLPPPAITQPLTTSTTTTTESPPALAPRPVNPARLTERPPLAKPSKRSRAKNIHEPLTVTPPLAAGPYLFPVAGTVAFGDSYGGPRNDVSGGWHHGDDIFAPLGTPVVAVADGTLNRVGWEKIGGWRLWVRDGAGDQFYYAHLSGYSPLALERGRVRAGEVIGFVGNTGDAFTTLPHLHFEIHPRPLLHLQYDGAVDPTTYLNSWHRLTHVAAGPPVHPHLPRATAARMEALQDFRKLLAARGLLPLRSEPLDILRPHPLRPERYVALAAAPPPGGHASQPWAFFGVSLAALAAIAALGVLARRQVR